VVAAMIHFKQLYYTLWRKNDKLYVVSSLCK